MSFHLYRLNELYSNADGSIQFIELVVGNFNGESFWQGQSITATQGATTHSFTFPGNLASTTTANRSVLVATQGFANLGLVTPDFIVPAQFLFTNGGTVNFAGVSSITYASLPTDGVHSINASNVVTTNSPRNFAGSSGSIAPPVNHDPTLANPIADRSTAEDAVFSFVVPANTFADADAGDTLSYTAGRSDAAALPAWLSFNAATRTFSGTPGNADVGVLNVRVTARDGSDAAASGDFALTVANANDAPTAGTYPNQTSGQGQPVALNLGLLFNDVDAGDALSYSATGLPPGIGINATSGVISGNAPGSDGVHHITVTATDTHAASASANFDFIVASGNTVSVNVLTRGGLALPGVTAHQLHSLTPAGSLYAYKNLSVDTAPLTGAKVLTADFVATGNSGNGALDLNFQAGAGAGFVSFDLTGPISAASGWTIVPNTSVANSFGLGASKPDSSIGADTLVGRLTLSLPGSASDNAVLVLNGATLGGVNAPDRSLAYSKVAMGSVGQLSTTLPDANLALSLERSTADYLVNGTTKPVTAADALDALKLSVGLAASKGNSWKELISSDINHDGRVTAADALEILKVSVGVNTIQPSWVFVPSDAGMNPNLGTMTKTTVTYANDINLASITGPTAASVTAILVGDVNNSWLIPA